MKNKIRFMLVITIVMVVAGYNVYKSQEVSVVELILVNYEAIAGEELGTGNYTRCTSQCPPPIQYKTAVSCMSGGREECYPSDC